MEPTDNNGINEYTRRIADILKEDRPREKALAHGMSALSTAELIAILLGSGTRGESVVDLSQRILRESGNRLSELSRRSVRNLVKSFRGIGEAKAITLLAAIELGKRFREEEIIQAPLVNTPDKAYELMRYQLAGLDHEEFWVIFMNNSKRVITKKQVSVGGVASTIVDVKIILKHAVECLATAMILVHNHPSSALRPSTQDDRQTEKLKAAAKLLDIDVVDHIIVGDSGYYSYASEGRL